MLAVYAQKRLFEYQYVYDLTRKLYFRALFAVDPISDTIPTVSTTKIAMHQTTVRFGHDLWAVLEQEADRLGVSAAQYIRDATLTRLAYASALRRDAVASREAFEWAAQAPLSERVKAQLDSSAALQAQGELARSKAERLRAEAEQIRERNAVRRNR